MKKFILAETGEEVEFGDVIVEVNENDYSKCTIIQTVTEYNISYFIEKGIIKEVEDNKNKKEAIREDLEFYIDLLALRCKKSSKEVTGWLDTMNSFCPKAALDLLLNEIALYFYNVDVEGFDKTDKYFSLRPSDGKVGRVVIINSHIPLFKSIEDAELARKILNKQLKLVYGE